MRKNILFIISFIILLLFTLSACTNNTDPKPIPTINDDIAALPSVEDITLNDADAILTIRQKIDNLSLDELSHISTNNLEKFLLIEDRLALLLEEEEKRVQIQAIEDKFSLLPPLDAFSMADYELYKSIMDAYNNLSAEQKVILGPEKLLLLNSYAEIVLILQKQEEMMKSIRLIEEKMALLPPLDDFSIDDYDLYKSIMDAYNNLSAEQKLLFSEEKLSLLKLYEEKVLNEIFSENQLIEEKLYHELLTNLSTLIPLKITQNIDLPTSYQELVITWSSNEEAILSSNGVYNRPYIATNVVLTANIKGLFINESQTYELVVEGYKVLSKGIASSYIYRNYSLVDDAFFDTLDIINCAFTIANASASLTGTTFFNNVSSYIINKAHAQGDWVIVSIAPESSWSTIAASPALVETFANNIVKTINTYKFDGVDIDWEYPKTGEEKLFTSMMEVIYNKVKANNPHHLVTAAIGAGMWQPPRYDLNNSQQYIDYINVMAYGMVSNTGYYQNALYKSTTYHNSTLGVGKTLTSCSIAETVDFYYKNYKVPYEKIIMGVAFYGMKQTRTFDGSTWSSWAKGSTVYYHTIVASYLNNPSYKEVYDNVSQVPYIINNDGTEFISYDNPTSILAKCDYILNEGLGGIMFWEYVCDKTGTLLAAMKIGLNK